jgi:monovalent cation/hydrogen antiporter
LRDLRRNWRPVTSLVLIAVGVTTAAVAVVVHSLVPGMQWSAAIALGAIVAPPDAAAASAVLQQLRLPHRLVVILEGESMLNDASALLVYRLAVSATVSNVLTASQVTTTLLVVFPGSLLAGWVLARIALICLRPLEDIPSSIVLQFVTTFGVWLLAEHIGLSSILTVVVYAITLARRAPREMPARMRVPSYAVWDTVVFVLNILAFVLIGLQLRPILSRLPPSTLNDYLLVAAAVVATVILVRIVWVMTRLIAVRWRMRRLGARYDQTVRKPPPIRGGLIVSWCGMRGIVTLAAALALPAGADGTPTFPHRDLVVFCAFAVVFGTLVLQGLTLKALVLALRLRDDDDLVGRETQLARAHLEQVGFLGGPPAEGGLTEELQDPVNQRALQLEALKRRRDALHVLREREEIGDDAFHRLEWELDISELHITSRGD